MFVCSVVCCFASPGRGYLTSFDSASIWDNAVNHELYRGSWNNVKVNPYDKQNIPFVYFINLSQWFMPIENNTVTSHFGYRASMKRFHYGTDLKLYIGDTVRSSFDGVIRIVRYDANGYGNYVVVRHTNGTETVYGHLSKHLVKQDQIVAAGQPIGLGGNTGRSTGSHLHYEVRIVGHPIDTELLFDYPHRMPTTLIYKFEHA